MQAVVFEAEEERARRGAQDVIGGDIAVFPWQGPDGIEDRVSFLTGRNEDGGRRGAGREGLRRGLLDFGTRRRGGREGRWMSSLECGNDVGKVGFVTKAVIHCSRGEGGLSRFKNRGEAANVPVR